MRCLFLLFSLISTLCWSQLPPDGLHGEGLRNWLKQQFYNDQHQQLGYREARVKMYNFIDNRDDALECVYGGLKRSLPFGGNESTPWPINAEHTVPQSFFGKKLPMKSDLHHLFPTFDKFNSIRANFPFEEIPDSQTDKWLLDRETTRNVPDENIDAYSESEPNRFEPREVHKGNAARAVFYFYTMYPQFPIGRAGDVDLFYAWHLADPVDERERARNDGIESHQGNRNPYVDHPEWVLRAWDRIDLDAVRVILTAMGHDPGLVDANVTPVDPGPGIGPAPNPRINLDSLAAAVRQLEDALRNQQSLLETLKAELDRLRRQVDQVDRESPRQN